MAFDADPDSDWATYREGAGSWIQSEFGATYRVARFEYRHRRHDEDNRQITLSFSDGSSQTFILQDDVNDTQSFAVTPVQSSFVRITVDSVYETVNNGARQITFYGSQQGKPPPPPPEDSLRCHFHESAMSPRCLPRALSRAWQAW